MFNWIDYAIIGILVFSVLVSMTRGFVRESISLATWILSFWVAFTFAGILEPELVKYIHSGTFRYFAAFLILLIGTMIIGAIINYIISKLVDVTGLNGTDRVLGIFFGALRGVLLVAILLMIAKLTPAPTETWWQSSVLIAQFTPLETWIHDMLPHSVKSHFTLNPTNKTENSP